MRETVDVPLGYPTTTIFVDESTAHAPAQRFFAMAALKVRRQGVIARAVHDIRDKYNFPANRPHHELKFKEVTHGNLPLYLDAVDLLDTPDVQVRACVVDKEVYNPFGRGREFWRVHADIACLLLTGGINKQELVTVLVDKISVPADFAYDEYVQSTVNRRLGRTAIVNCVCLDSQSTDMLQLADLAAGSIAYDRGLQVATYQPKQEDKKKVATRLKAALGGVDFKDGRNGRVNVATYRPRPRVRGARGHLAVISGSARG